MERLQGLEFTKMKNKLVFVNYSVSKKGNIRVNMRRKLGIVTRYYHWLNEEEKKRFMQSKYYNNSKYLAI